MARVVDQEFDCGERWVRVDGLVCGLVYASCHGTTWEEGKKLVEEIEVAGCLGIQLV